jgi:hypothetical protein
MEAANKVIIFREVTPPTKADKHVVVIGNLTEGYQVHGPFDSFDEAAHWYDYESRLQHLDCWIMELRSVTKDMN